MRTLHRVFQESPLLLAGLILPVAVGLAGCGPGASANEEADGRLSIVATTGMIADVARNIAGDRADVHALMAPGVDPHLYRPRRSDVSRLLEADLVLYNGLHLEGRMAETFEQIERSGRFSVAVAETLDESLLLESEDYPGTFDPHLWMDVRAWMEVTRAIEDALVSVDSDGEAIYRQRGVAYRDDLESLHQWTSETLATIPQEQRVLVTAHDAFNYFARAYSLQVEAIQGISTDSEAGLRRIEELVERLVAQRIGAIFTESSVSDKNVRTLIDGAAARGHDVTIGGELYSDALGEEGTPAGTYIGMIEHNVRTIARALGGQVEERDANQRVKRQD